jgi:tetratricopeptide (TPR) repeat protein
MSPKATAQGMAPITDVAPEQAKTDDKLVGPRDAVSRPTVRRAKSEAGEMLGTWGWTDSHDAIDDDNDDAVDEAKVRRKHLVYAIGGALGVISLIAIIALAAGGSDRKTRPTVEQDTRTAAPTPAPSAESPDDAPRPAATASVEAKQAEAERLAKQQADKEEAAKKAEHARLAKQVAAKQNAERAKVATARKSETPKKVKTSPKPVDPYAATGATHDPAAAYRTGFQQYARGDTAGALATFQRSLAATPGYPVTYRGLGMVYEKMGNKAQARRAFHRYLQLSPSASDAKQIRERMRKL